MNEPLGVGGEGENASQTTETVADRIGQQLQQLLAAGGANAAFGEPHTVGDRTVIPAAEVMRGFGFGMGSGQGRGPGTEQAGSGSGGGAGGGTRTRPVAAIVVGPEGVSVEPIIDMTQVWMAGITAAAFSLLWMRRLRRRMWGMPAAAEGPSPKKLGKMIQGK